jgi:hypothetical protein
MAGDVVLKKLLRQKHWQTYRTFCRQYDNAARMIDASLVGSYPSRAQLHRWQSGDVKGLPYPHHCEVLEAMFPGVTVQQMFAPAEQNNDPVTALTAIAVTESPGLHVSFPVAIGQHSDERVLAADSAERIARSVVLLGKSMRLPETEIAELGKLAGNLVDLQLECSIDIDAGGWALVTYRHEVLNLTSRAMKRMTREQWFETTSGALKIEPHPSNDRRVHIQRIHDTTNMSKFACQFSPEIEPGEAGTISYTSRGGRFVHDHYWRQSIPRYTRYFTLRIRHCDVAMLLNCTAIEERVDGSETSVIEDLVCSDEGGDALITLTRDHLQPGQTVTVRWEVSHATSRLR